MKKILNLIERGWLAELRENSALIEKNLNSEKKKIQIMKIIILLILIKIIL